MIVHELSVALATLGRVVPLRTAVRFQSFQGGKGTIATCAKVRHVSVRCAMAGEYI